MSHLSQLVSDALANARVGDGVKMHQPDRDRVLLTDQGQDYVVLVMPRNQAALIGEVVEAYGDDVMGEVNFDYAMNALGEL